MYFQRPANCEEVEIVDLRNPGHIYLVESNGATTIRVLVKL